MPDTRVAPVIARFWAWYERNYALNITIAGGLFVVQLVHLVWLTFDPLWGRVFEQPAFVVDKPWSWPLLLVDYTEIPALISVSLVYLNDLRKDASDRRAFLYLVFLNSQWLHIFWITDEFVVESGGAGGASATALPGWLAYLAILIDYLELPVIVDTLRKIGPALAERRGRTSAQEDVA